MSTLLVLDFDGVICDSIDECFLSSWKAYHELYRRQEPASVSLAARRAFGALRPFIRTGEDFVLIQELLAVGASVGSQQAFDEAMAAAGAGKKALWRELFYAARTTLLEQDRAAWLRMNRIYPHVAKALAPCARQAPCAVLSTKKPQFIAEILAAHGMELPLGRIHFADGSAPKLAIVERLRREGGFASAILVEDQIDAIRGNTNPMVKGLLAAWGYVKPEWLEELPAGEVLRAGDFQGLVEGLTA